MKLKLTTDKPAGLLPVITDPEARTSEVLDADHIHIVDFRVNTEAKVIQVAVVFGGYDSSGKWHTDVRQKAAAVSISGERPEQAEAYNSLACDESGNPHCCFDEAWFRRLLVDEGILKLLQDRVWAFDEVMVEIDGECCFEYKTPKTSEKG